LIQSIASFKALMASKLQASTITHAKNSDQGISKLKAQQSSLKNMLFIG
jgi:hypothetical protein